MSETDTNWELRDSSVFSSLKLLLKASDFTHKWTLHTRTSYSANGQRKQRRPRHRQYACCFRCCCVFSGIFVVVVVFLGFVFFLSFCWVGSLVIVVVSYLFMSWTTFSRKPCQISSRKPLINCDNFWCLYDMTCFVCVYVCTVYNFFLVHNNKITYTREQHESFVLEMFI